MINSMTGFARKSTSHAGVIIEIEIRTLNSRFLDLSLKMPKIYLESENGLRTIVSELIARGRVEISINRNDATAPQKQILFNESLFLQYFQKTEEQLEIVSKAKVTSEIKQQLALEILTRKDVFETSLLSEALTEAEIEVLKGLLKLTIKDLQIMRWQEGQTLLAHLESLLADFSMQLTAIDAQRIQSKLVKANELSLRLSAIKTQLPVDEQRVAQEIAILIERSDISEELERLKSHLGQFELCFKNSGAGKKLEFLVQECLREVNTIGSKAADSKITQCVIEAKSILEKLREQVANVE